MHLLREEIPAARGDISEGLRLAREYGNIFIQIFALVEAAAEAGDRKTNYDPRFRESVVD
jgi:hypothetical protein